MPRSTCSNSLVTLLLLLNLALLVFSQGSQFITGPCTSDADCASGCCGFNSGKCAGPVVAQERDGGCGFGDGTPNDRAAQAFRNGGATSPAPANPNTGGGNTGNNNNNNGGNGGANPGTTATGTQFITGACTSDADCASGCCGFNSGKCAGPVVAQERDGGCGFGDNAPNDRAAQAFRNGGAMSPANPPPATGNTGNAGNTGGGNGNGNGNTGGNGNGNNIIDTSIPGSQNVGNGNGRQFITGQCFRDADCASGCCGFNSGKCAGAVIAQTRDGGCGFGNNTPNDDATRALGAKNRRDIEMRV
ncbi:hypothetical protein PV10_01493 [Exophiala mesophila]|uniref:Biotrophy-associated secreted protein 2 n=1 Tax=Exophiala mesophila TaxID=212818 RepID=A0A0D1X7F1_EXOME|nr:uncharacterized protein PV10_01493 [Exophiala mesophila]KIV97785.1 hypothetical protein PV10_01493 [Exophiala mesophila]